MSDANAAITDQQPVRWSVVQVAGEIDIATVPGLRDQLHEVDGSAGVRGVIVDMEAVTFMDCSGLSPLVEARSRLGDRLWLRGLQPQVARLLRLTGLEACFRIVEQGAAEPADLPSVEPSGAHDNPRERSNPGPRLAW